MAQSRKCTQCSVLNVPTNNFCCNCGASLAEVRLVGANKKLSRAQWAGIIILAALLVIAFISILSAVVRSVISSSGITAQIVTPDYVGKWVYHSGFMDVVLTINSDHTGDFANTPFTWEDDHGQMQATAVDKNTNQALRFSVEAGGSEQVIVHGWDSFGLRQGATSVFNRLQ